jgi:hypothetical protein
MGAVYNRKSAKQDMCGRLSRDRTGVGCGHVPPFPTLPSRIRVQVSRIELKAVSGGAEGFLNRIREDCIAYLLQPVKLCAGSRRDRK